MTETLSTRHFYLIFHEVTKILAKKNYLHARKQIFSKRGKTARVICNTNRIYMLLRDDRIGSIWKMFFHASEVAAENPSSKAFRFVSTKAFFVFVLMASLTVSSVKGILPV